MRELSEIQHQKLSVLLETASGFFAKVFDASCCLNSTRILVKIIKDKMHMKARPLSVTATIFNSLMIEKGRAPANQQEGEQWRDEGCWMMVVGSRDEYRPGRWPGHLVALVYDCCIVDCSITQANRPAKNIVMRPLIVPVRDERFLRAESALLVPELVNGCKVFYDAFPEDKSWSRTPGWCRPDRTGQDIEGRIWREYRRKMG
jgi:hypothetical protein